MYFYLLLILVGSFGNILCIFFIISPFAKNILIKKIIFLSSVLSIIISILTSMFIAKEKFSIIIFIIHFIIISLFIYSLIKFIKNNRNWKHYIFLTIFLISILWNFFFNWQLTDSCVFGSCV